MYFLHSARFDVRRGNKGKFTIGTVTKVDFSGLQKRVKFHFSKTSIDRDEWIPLGSDSIAPLYSMVSIQITKKDKTGGNGTDKFSVLDEGNFTIGGKFNSYEYHKKCVISDFINIFLFELF